MQDLTPMPIYRQVSDLIARDIASGRLGEGVRLPPERELAAAHGISVGTLRKALGSLEAQGMIERRQGSGNYVRPTRGADGIYAFFRLERPQGGGTPSAETISVARQTKPEDLPEFGTSADAHRIRRLRALDGIVVAAEEIWLDGACVAQISASDLSDSLYQFYKHRLGFWIARAEDRLSVAPKPNWAPQDFPKTCGFATRMSWAQSSRAIEFSRSWFHPSRAVYISRLK